MAKKYTPLYIPPAVTVDVVLFTIQNGTLSVLLINRTSEPFKKEWALPGGFVRTFESTNDAANRILKDKAGVGKIYIEQLYTFDKKGRDPRGHVLTVSYMALVNANDIRFKKSPNIQNPKFYPIKHLPFLAFDHKRIIEYALKRLHNKIEYSNIIYSLMTPAFTLSQLQRAYEIVLGKTIDKRNFRKKTLSLELLKPVHRRITGFHQRPAELYAFRKRTPVELKRFF